MEGGGGEGADGVHGAGYHGADRAFPGQDPGEQDLGGVADAFDRVVAGRDLSRPARPSCGATLRGLVTDEGVAVGGAFDSDTATGIMPAAQCVAGMLTS
jgi:hypothetical protein